MLLLDSQTVLLYMARLSPTAESDGVSAQIGSGVGWGGSEVRFRGVPRGFRENSARVLQKLREGSGVVRGGLHEGSTGQFQGGFHEGSARVWEGVVLLGISPELIVS